MRELTTLLMTWLAVTAIYLLLLTYTGVELFFHNLPNAVMLGALTALFSGIYIVIFGGPIFYFLLKQQKVTRLTFLFSGLIAAIPITLLSLISGDILWVISSITAGIVAGGIFAVCLPNRQRT